MTGKREFIQGIACAAAYIARERDEPGMASNMVHDFGYTYRDLKRAGTDQYDLDALKKEMLADERFERERKRQAAEIGRCEEGRV